MLITDFYIRKILTSLILKALNCWPIPLSQRLFEVRADWANWVLYMHDVEYIGIFHTGQDWVGMRHPALNSTPLYFPWSLFGKIKQWKSASANLKVSNKKSTFLKPWPWPVTPEKSPNLSLLSPVGAYLQKVKRKPINEEKWRAWQKPESQSSKLRP